MLIAPKSVNFKCCKTDKIKNVTQKQNIKLCNNNLIKARVSQSLDFQRHSAFPRTTSSICTPYVKWHLKDMTYESWFLVSSQCISYALLAFFWTKTLIFIMISFLEVDHNEFKLYTNKWIMLCFITLKHVPTHDDNYVFFSNLSETKLQAKL